jgi:hypothetical protein
MSCSDYSQVATGVVNLDPSSFVVVLDQNPFVFTKLSSEDYISQARNVQSWFVDLLTKFPDLSFPHWFFGGHSAGGMSAAGALTTRLQDAISVGKVYGYIGFDPYSYSEPERNNPSYDLPVRSLIWSLTKSSSFLPDLCHYDTNKSGYGFYIHGSSIGTECTKHYLYTFTDNSEHCVFTDKGCFLGVTYCIGSGTVTQAITWQHVAQSIVNFIQLDAAIYPSNSSSVYSNVLFRERQVCNTVPVLSVMNK